MLLVKHNINKSENGKLKNKGKNIDILDTEKETFRIPKTTNNNKNSAI